MNLPNKLTLLRILLVPACLILAALHWYIPAAIIFIAAAVTDALDGSIARKHNLVTNFGKFADPIADKLLSVTMLILLGAQGRLPLYLALVVVIRELAVDGLRLIAVEQGKVVAAGMAGKVKTATTMVLIPLAMVFSGVVIDVLALVVAALTVYSGVTYFYALRDIFTGDFHK